MSTKAKEVAKPKAGAKAIPKTPKAVSNAMAKVKVDLSKKPAAKADVKKEEPKVSPVKVEYQTVKDACDAVSFKKGIYGAFNPEDDFCKDCIKDFPETAKVCEANTKLMKATAATKKAGTTKAAKPKKEKKPGAPKVPKADVPRDCFGRKIDSGAGRIDAMLLRAKGASMEEMEVERKAVGSHLSQLKVDGFTVEFKDGRYYAKAPAKK
jgi:hypothetical protein